MDGAREDGDGRHAAAGQGTGSDRYTRQDGSWRKQGPVNTLIWGFWPPEPAARSHPACGTVFPAAPGNSELWDVMKREDRLWAVSWHGCAGKKAESVGERLSNLQKRFLPPVQWLGGDDAGAEQSLCRRTQTSTNGHLHV